MCKIMVMTGINNKNRSKSLEFIKEMAKEMSPGNKDGCGYAGIDSEGKLFGERWLDNSEAFAIKGEMQKFGDAIEQSGEYNSFGDVKLNDICSITLHTRFATSSKGMQNTHPFVYTEDDTSLIHNGIIDNYKDFKLKVSTCDSEALLQAYLGNEINKDTSMLQPMSDSIYGYYAVGIYSRDKENKRILDVFKGNHASLVLCYIVELGCYVFTTSEMDIVSACRKLSLTLTKSYNVKEGNLIRLDPFTSEVLLTDKFKVNSRHKPVYNSHYYNGSNDRGYSHTTTSVTGTHTKNNETSNIIDVSSRGIKERQLKNNVAEAMFNMKSCMPSIRKLSTNEVKELGIANGWWRTEK